MYIVQLKGKPGSKVIVSVYTLKPDLSAGQPPDQFSIDEQDKIVSRFKSYMQGNNNQGLIEMKDDILDFSACIINQVGFVFTHGVLAITACTHARFGTFPPHRLRGTDMSESYTT